MRIRIITILILLLGITHLYGQELLPDSTTKAPGYYPIVELRNQLNDILNDPNFNNAFWGVNIKSLKTGEIIYKKNSDKLFIPASTMKLFTTSAALLLLGSNYHYKTTLFTNGIIENNTVKGDLILRGEGDPTFSSRFLDGKPTKVFQSWVDLLKSKGIKKVTGNIIGDDNLFDDRGLGKGWSWEYESLWFSAPSGALSFNDNSVDVNVIPTEVNLPAVIKISPNTKYITIINRVITVDNNSEEAINVYRKKGTNIITVFGTIKKSSESVKEFVSISDPTLYTATVFNEVLESNDIEVKGYVTDLDNEDKIINYDDCTPIAEQESVSLSEIIKEINKNSNNFYAEQLIKTIGLEIYGYGSVDNGVKACDELFNKMGINSDNMVYADGSGLSRLDLVTPKQLVNLLNFMYKSDEFDTFYDSLPIAGIDGNLALRMKKSNAWKNLRAKPGLNNGVTALAGYVSTLDGEPFAFSLMVNNFLVPSNLANYIIDSICIRLANFTRKN
jgi:D-alanyl-D-alanine carboxypeptidase/D-alanyl-D-alanine-endopeptidase (penicillin-binding protein 4)